MWKPKEENSKNGRGREWKYIVIIADTLMEICRNNSRYINGNIS